MTRIKNLTQHEPTAEQLACGVGETSAIVKELITFSELPTKSELIERAEKLAQLTSEEGYKTAMVGGAGYFMPYLCEALRKAGITPLMSFTERVSTERVLDTGEVVKTAVFKHIGWVEC